MRNIEYITNGFGGPIPVPPAPSVPSYLPSHVSNSYAGPSSAQWFNYAPIETKIRAYLESVPVPQYMIEAAVQTYRTSGYSGFKKTVDFINYFYDSLNAEHNAYLSRPYKGSKPGLEFKNIINRSLNTAFSRIGSNSFINAISTFYKSIFAQIPDSEPYPDGWISRKLKNKVSNPANWIVEITQIVGNKYG